LSKINTIMTTVKNSNKVNFNGEERYPDYAVLLPCGGSVLCRAGASLGLSAIISRKEANRKGIEYLRPVKWEYSDLYIYPNGEVRNKKGNYYGKYLGHDQDDLSGGIISSSDYGGAQHDIFILKESKIYRVNCFGESTQYNAEGMIQCRLHWSTCWNISGKSYPEPEDFLSVIRELSKSHPMALQAALELQRMQRYDERPDKSEEIHSTSSEADV
jgi:hypothetical protein